jgi:uncharacterized integral membrane protein
MAAAPPPAKKGGKFGMILCFIGGILGIIGPFIIFQISMSIGGISTSATYSLASAEFGKYSVGWLMLVGGLLAMIFGLLAFMKQNKLFGMLALIGGLLEMLAPIIVAAMFSGDSGGMISFGGAFYTSISVGGNSMTYMMLGGILALIGGLLALFGGLMLFTGIKKATAVPPPSSPFGQPMMGPAPMAPMPPPGDPYAPQAPPPYGAPPPADPYAPQQPPADPYAPQQPPAYGPPPGY